jgi:hypothetical protein
VVTLRSALFWVVAAALPVSLAACSRYYWSKPGATVEQLDQYNRHCALQTSADPTEASHGMVNEKVYRACLEARQWVRKKELTPPPAGSYRGFE